MRTGRPIAPLSLAVAERATLEGWARRPKSAQALAQRSRIVLECAGGSANTAVADAQNDRSSHEGILLHRMIECRSAVRKYIRFVSVAAIALLLACLWSPAGVAANRGEEQVCDITADYFLGAKDYPEAIRLHREVLRKHPESALAHYHLGFAEGMVGNKTQELNEYRRAAALGLSSWDLFLNTGLALFENGSLEAATDALRLAVRLAPNRPEPHFNLGLVYERRGMLIEAEQEMLSSLSTPSPLLRADLIPYRLSKPPPKEDFSGQGQG